MNLSVLVFFFLCLLAPAVGGAAPIATSSTPHFSIHYDQPDSHFTYFLSGQVERVYSQVRTDLGVIYPVTVQVRVCGSEACYQQSQPAGNYVPSWSAAVAYPSQSLIIMKSPNLLKTSFEQAIKILTHELVHVGLGQTSAFPVPRWLDEGVAMYESGEWSIDRYLSMVGTVMADKLIPLRELTANWPDETTAAELAYGQSYYLTAYLITAYGPDSFRSFLRYYLSGASFEAALKRAFGLGLFQLEVQWHSFMRLRFSYIPIITSSGTLWLLITILFVIVYVKKKRHAARQLEIWALEEERIEAGRSIGTTDPGGYRPED
ncbi:MAG: hypothetical protein HQK59_12445 [Deltaproteobacteria bacterium]|nr:hypothetical protein [Deltaproteobacteria bacterium]